MRLVERDAALAVLRDAVAGQGPRVVLVSGEAGAGKSSLVRALAQETDAVVLGSCDSLRAARPLAPVFDWLGRPPDGDLLGSVRALLDSVQLAVVEDLHWADDATLDLLSQLVRRPAAPGATLLLTYRDDEVDAQHPLTLLLGDLAPLSPTRLKVPPLTHGGVAELAAGSGLDTAELLARTGGNAFLVSECLAAGSLDVTDGIRDAVMGRLVRLGSDVKTAVEAVACIPGRCELWLALALGADLGAIDSAVGHGLLLSDGHGRVAMRHELARRAVEDGIPLGHRQQLHQKATDALIARAGGTDHSRVVHHALLADDTSALAEHAALAADEALRAGARTQAVAQLELALAHAPSSPEAGRWWELLAQQRALLGDMAGATAAYDRAISEASDPVRAAVLRIYSSRPLTRSGRSAAARSALEQGIAVLERARSREGLAIAYAEACSLHMLARELDDAQVWGQRARELAREIGDVTSESTARVQEGVATWMAGDTSGLALLRSGVALAEQHELTEVVSLGYLQIGSGGGEIRAYAEAMPALETCIAYTQAHELADRRRYAQAWWGRCLAETGQWDRASHVLAERVRSPRTEALTRLTALTALGRLRTRRGDPGADVLLDEALALADLTGHLQRLWPVAAARAESAWLAGDLMTELAVLERAHALARDLDYWWAKDELAFWLERAGQQVSYSGRTPYAGGPDAPEQWRDLGCPYEQAEALITEGRDLEGLTILEGLGAAPLVQRIVQQRRVAGLRVPRGPNASTRRTPGGLTDRELEVLRCVAAGQTNAQIAAALHISPKTAGHHVSHLLDKLDVRSRAGAVARASQLGIELTDI